MQHSFGAGVLIDPAAPNYGWTYLSIAPRSVQCSFKALTSSHHTCVHRTCILLPLPFILTVSVLAYLAQSLFKGFCWPVYATALRVFLLECVSVVVVEHNFLYCLLLRVRLKGLFSVCFPHPNLQRKYLSCR